MPLAVNALNKMFEMEMRQFVHVGDFPSVNNSSTILVESSTHQSDIEFSSLLVAPAQCKVISDFLYTYHALSPQRVYQGM